MSIDPRTFRQTVGQFVTGVTVIAMEVDGSIRALTANSFTSLSLNPPLVLFCLVAVESSVLDAYVGRYQLTEGNTLIVSHNGNELLVTGEGQEAFDMLFQNESGMDVEAAQSAVIEYLNSSEGPQLRQWKTRMTETLGEFKELNVIGTAAPLGNGEPWTYVSFEFERGSALTRWIVSPAGALEAALLETEPPYVIFLPESEHQFAPFSLSAQSSVQGIEFATGTDGKFKMMISVPTGLLEATKIISES